MAVNIGSAVAYLELDTSKFTKGFQSALNDLRVFGDRSSTASQKMKGLQSALSTTGSLLSKNVTVPILGVGTAAVKVATDFEKQMSAVQAISGATGDQFKDLENTAIELGASTAFSASEVAQAMTEMAKAGWDSQQIIDGMAGVLDAAAASGEDLANVGTIVADAITTFGLSASESTRVADLLTQSANSGTIGINDLAESFKYIGPVANTMGFSIEDVTTAITALSTAGIKGSQAGTTLRSMFARMVKPTDQVAIAMEQLGISLADSEGNFYSMDEILRQMRTTFSRLTPEQQTYYATVLAGQEGMSGLTTLLGITQEEYDKISESMQNATGIADQTARTMQDNLAGAIEQLGGALESAGIIIGNQLIPYIRALAEWITGLIERFNSLDEGTQSMIIRIALIVAAIGPAMLILSKLLSVINGVASAVTFFTSTVVPAVQAFTLLKNGATVGQLALEGFSKSTLGVVSAIAGISAPVIAAVAVIGTLVAAFVTLWNTSDSFRSNITNTFNGIVDSFNSFFDGIVERINALGFDFESMTEVLKAAWQSFCSVLEPLFTGAFEGVATIISGTLNAILGVMDVFIGVFTGNWEQAAEGVKEILGSLFDTVTEVIGGIFETLGGMGEQILTLMGLEEAGQKVSEFFTVIGDFFRSLPETILSVLPQIGEGIATFFTVTIPETFNNFINVTVPNFVNSFITWLNELPYNLGYMIGQFVGQLAVWGQQMGEWVATNIPVIIDNIVNWFKQLPGRVWQWLSDTLNRAKTWGSEMVSNGKQAASNFVDSVINFVKNLPQRIWDIIKQIPGRIREIGSQMKQAGKDILNNLWDGIKSIGEGILGWFGDFVGKIKSFIGGIIDGFNDVVSGASRARSAAQSVDGSHANGLAYVPFDGYVAELHKGERVLTAQENRDYNNGVRNGNGGDTFNFYNTKPDPYEYARQMKRVKREILLGV